VAGTGRRGTARRLDKAVRGGAEAWRDKAWLCH
jgi:hypothetical protein